MLTKIVIFERWQDTSRGMQRLLVTNKAVRIWNIELHFVDTYVS